MAKIEDIEIPHLIFDEVAAPSTPASGTVAVYAKSDGLLYSKDDAGAETGLGGGVSDILDLPTAEMDDTLVLAPDGAGGVEFRAEAGGGGVVADRDSRTGGNLTLNGTSWAAVPSISDLVVAAVTGDCLLCWVAGLWGAEAVVGNLDMATMVSASPVNYISGGNPATPHQGVLAWYGSNATAGATLNIPIAGSVHYVVQSGDISGGNVTLQMRGRTGTASNKTIFGSATLPLLYGVINLGQ